MNSTPDFLATLDELLPPVDGGRAGWRHERERLEADPSLRARPGRRGVTGSPAFDAAVAQLGRALRRTSLWERGLRNAADLRLARLELACPELPAAFDGFRILHLTDLHVDSHPETTAAAAALVRGVEADVCVLTGDYRAAMSGPFHHILGEMRELVAAVTAPHGVYGVLGNHDCAAMVGPLEGLGVRMLVNESVSVHRAGERLAITGLDDVHEYYTERARAALDTTPRGFRVALVHSPEIADVVARAGFHLYLSGHSHGGQICLPGSIPVITALRRFRRHARGLWRHGPMLGYTSTGTGVSGLPLRFHTRGEVALLTLRAAAC